MDLQTMIERAHAQLARRQAALKLTLEQIALIEPLEEREPGAYTHALTAARTKRDRQTSAVKATEGLLRTYNAALKKPAK